MTGKLRNNILAFTLPLTLVPFLLTALAVYYFVVRSDQSRIEEEQNQRLAEAIVGIRREQEAARRDVALIANLPSIAEYLESLSEGPQSGPTTQGGEETVRANLKLFFDQNPYYLQLSLVDAHGQDRVRLSKLPQPQLVKSNEDLFRRAVIARDLAPEIQMPVEAVQPRLFTSVFTSRVRRRTFAGVVVLHLNTAVFERHLRPLLSSHQLSTILFDDRGVVFAKSVRGVDEDNALKQIDVVNEATAILSRPTGGISKREISVTGNEYVLSVLPAEELIAFMEPTAGEKWFLGALRPSGILPQQTRKFQWIFFMILLAALAAVVWVTRRASRHFTGPLEQMAEATTKIARGQFDISLGIKTGDEVEELATAVKQMADDLKKHQIELIKSAKLAALGEMASEVSHEIQNRISGLSLWIQYLDDEIGQDDPKREYLQEMKEGLQGFNQLLADLKQLYRTPVLQMIDSDLNEIVRESLPYVEQKVREKDMQVELQLDPELPVIRCDGNGIKGVILNLLLNAVEAGADRITVTTGTEIEPENSQTLPSESVVLSVRDNGPGISPSELPQIFYPFHSTKPGGSGLGLAIASNLVTAHGGKIKVESEVGHGAKFTVTFKTASMVNA